MSAAKFLICASAMLAWCTELNAIDLHIEGKAAYFLPQVHKFREIYSGGGLYGCEVSFQTKNRLYGWVSIDSFSKRGESLGHPCHTKISMLPLGIGLKYCMPLYNWPVECYLGAGLLATHVAMYDGSPYVTQKTSKWGAGGIAKGGFLFKCDAFFLDLFTNYSYCSIDFHHEKSRPKVQRHSMNFGGWTFGVGVGRRFCL